MKIFRSLEAARGRRPSAITIGNFDGVHRGHMKIIDRLKSIATQVQAAPTLLTFSPHPQQVLHGRHPQALATLDRKLELLDGAGIEQVVIMEFNKELSLVEPEDFIQDMLVDALHTKAVVVGATFRFGHYARGDAAMLKSAGKRLGFDFSAVGLMRLRGRTVSSTEIRHALAEGNLKWATSALARPHLIPGTVVEGHGRGAKIGFPTANLRPPEHFCVPKIGIYAGYFVRSQKRLPAAISIGTNPTFGGPHSLSIEAHILNFKGDLTGEEAGIELMRFLREEKTFRGVGDLSAAIDRDVKDTRKVLGIS